MVKKNLIKSLRNRLWERYEDKKYERFSKLKVWYYVRRDNKDVENLTP